MSRGPTTFRQRDAAALIKAARSAGLEIERIEVGRDGKIVVVTKKPGAKTGDTEVVNEWDDVLK